MHGRDGLFPQTTKNRAILIHTVSFPNIRFYKNQTFRGLDAFTFSI